MKYSYRGPKIREEIVILAERGKKLFNCGKNSISTTNRTRYTRSIERTESSRTVGQCVFRKITLYVDHSSRRSYNFHSFFLFISLLCKTYRRIVFVFSWINWIGNGMVRVAIKWNNLNGWLKETFEFSFSSKETIRTVVSLIIDNAIIYIVVRRTSLTVIGFVS